MANSLYSLSKLFTDRLYRIPDYQRGYAWTEKQLNDFWSDLLTIEADKKHYAGVITLEAVPKETWRKWSEDIWLIRNKGYEPFFVVDGQQRLTTSLILIQCFIESVPAISGKINLTTVADIKNRFISASSDKISTSYIFGYDSGNHNHKFLSDVIFTSQPNRRNLEETAYTSNLEYAKDFFKKKVGTLKGTEEKDTIFRALVTQINFNVFEIEDEVDVNVAFESMNNRGKPLSHLELLKNRLIYLTTRLSSRNAISDITRLRSKINEAWKAVYYHLGRNKLRLLEDDIFLFTHSLNYFGSHYTKNIDDTDGYFEFNKSFRTRYCTSLLEEIFTPNNILPINENPNPAHKYPVDLNCISNYVTDLQRSIEIWFDLLNPTLSSLSESEKIWLERLTRINIKYFQPLVLAVFSKETESVNRIKFLKYVERHYFIFGIMNPSYSSNTNSTSYDFVAAPYLIEYLKGKTTLEKLILRMNEEVESAVKEKYLEHVISRIAQSPNGFYGWNGIRYFLYEYEQELKSSTKTTRDKISWHEFLDPPIEHISIEHIYPKKATDAYWKERFGNLAIKKRQLLLGALGNLLALSKPKNSSLQNKSFPEKKVPTTNKKSENEKLIGYRYGSLSENKVAEINDWTPEQIIKRSLELFTFMQKRWSFSLGDDKEISKILGLDKVNQEKKVRLTNLQSETTEKF